MGLVNSYSQNNEDFIVWDYFKGKVGSLLEIGANDGITLSNSKFLIEQGWYAHLVEPGNIFNELFETHKDNRKVVVHNIGIGKEKKRVFFYESGPHIKGGNDKGLVSTADFNEMKKWPGVKFNRTSIQLIPYKYLFHRHTFDFISIDAEGMDWEILQQIDLKHTSCLCIEWNSKEELRKLYIEYCQEFRILHTNAENLIFVR